MGDVEVKDWKDENGGGDMNDKEEEVICLADPGEGGGAEGEEGGDGKETENHVRVTNPFDEEGFLDEEI